MTAWDAYQAHIRETVRVRWQERGLLLLWLGIVETTHRDTYTMTYLEDTIRLGTWHPKLIAQARALVTWMRIRPTST